MPYFLDEKDITNKPFIIGDTQYPSKWIERNPPEVWQALGITWVDPEPTPEPAPFIPQQVTMRQARLQLITLGVYQQVNAAVTQMDDAAQVEWEYAAVVDITNPLVMSMGQLLGWNETDIDNYFIDASLL